MKFHQIELRGAVVVEPELLKDSRGFFARVWCQKEFEQNGLVPQTAQCNISYNNKKATVRGMHYQVAPYQETKLVRCTAGAIYDVIIDLRPDSPTFRKWAGVELTADNRKMLYVPEGFAHGYQTLTDDSEVFYQVSQFYTPQSEGGVRWDDPALQIEWPIKKGIVISEKDNNWPLL